MSVSKTFETFDEAVADIPNGATILIGNFAGPGGTPYYLIRELCDHGAKNLTIIANTAGGIGLTLDYNDHRILFENKQVKKVIASFPFSISASRASPAVKQITAGEVELEIVPQGTLAERIRAGGAGIPAFYTPTGVGTVAEEGKEKKTFGGREYLLELALRADFALIKGHKADRMRNLTYRMTARNFNPVMATAATITIAEVDEIVDVGKLDPETVVTPGIYVNRIVKGEKYDVGFK